ncbi:cyclin-K-like isoform X2 [Anneissia japonica]|uniref:cyclin-K-like isoform X1 n=1 Tax=Anneissia japonica TaxID=1529436 RepID=UPI00142593D2|nr:cyclin-K-like isoform X1 [Anneissia japonica]XP_033125867.1 cyclin-K-like isoform X2 [Anneissia japonica]
MPYWLYDKDELVNTPSTKDSIDPSTEARYRREGARFIIEVGTELGLRFDTMASGVVYYHRFYMIHSFKEFPRFVTGAACLFLAGKVEETPKKCKDIIRVARIQIPDAHWTFFGDDPREEIMTYERILLQTLKFDLQIEHPYSYLLKHAKSFKGEKDKIQKLVQMAWTFVNDSLCTTLCLEWEPDIISIAFLYLAGRLSKSDLLDWTCKNSRIKWWENLNEEVTIDMLEEICHRLLDLYASGQQEKKGVPPPTPTKVSTKRHRSKTPPVGDADHTPPITEPVAKVPKPAPVIEPKPTPAPIETLTPAARPTLDQPDWSKKHVPPPVVAATNVVPPQTTTASYPPMTIPPVSNYTAPPPVQQQYNHPYPVQTGGIQQPYNPSFKTAPQQYQQPPPVSDVQNTQYGGYGSQYGGYASQQPQQQQQPQAYNQPNTYNQNYPSQPTPSASYSGPPPVQRPPVQRPPVTNMSGPPPNMNVPPPAPGAQNVHRHGSMNMHTANMSVPPPPLRNAPPTNMNVPHQMGGPTHRQPTVPTKPPPNYGAFPPAQDNKPMDYPPQSQYGNYNQPHPSMQHQMNTAVRPPPLPQNMNPRPSVGLPTIRITGRPGHMR